jgi:hypothetical protein
VQDKKGEGSMRKCLAVMALLAIALMVSATSASAITVNGLIDGAEWNDPATIYWTHVTDPNESNIADNYDASNFYVTNNATDMYFRFDVFGVPTLSGASYYAIYIDSDINASTGYDWEGIGAEAYIKYYLIAGVPTAKAATWNILGYWNAETTVLGAHNASGITELGASYASLGVSGQNQVLKIRGYVDGGNTNPDDLTVITGYPAPEPTSMALLGIGLLGAIGTRLKRKK